MANKSFPRSRRVAQQIQQGLSELIRREVRDPRLGMVTLTEVRMSSDLGYATVYYSVLGGDAQQAQEILDASAGKLRGPLGRVLGIRHSPELRFVQDELIESGARLSALISRAVRDDEARHIDEPASDEGAHGQEIDDAADAHDEPLDDGSDADGERDEAPAEGREQGRNDSGPGAGPR